MPVNSTGTPPLRHSERPKDPVAQRRQTKWRPRSPIPGRTTPTLPAQNRRPTRSLRARRVMAGLACVFVLTGIVLLPQQYFRDPLPARLQDGLTLAVSVLIESLPFVILGILLSVVIQVWVPPPSSNGCFPGARGRGEPCCLSSGCSSLCASAETCRSRAVS
nr:hypothetical protein GCM10025699_11160 [Microbacterium flavescens]